MTLLYEAGKISLNPSHRPTSRLPAKGNPISHTLVVVFLRGGADGLHMVVPYAEPAYHQLRPTLRIPSPGDHKEPEAHRALDLDGFFGFHPALEPLLDIWKAGQLALIHAVGAPDDSRSHFKAMELIERGVTKESGPVTGWLGRVLSYLPGENPSPLRAVSLGEQIPRSLYGPTPAAAVPSLADYQLEGAGSQKPFAEALSLLHGGTDPVSISGRETLQVMETLQQLDQGIQQPDEGYPETRFGRGLQQLARLIQAEVGVEIAAVDLAGWDTHFAQGIQEGLMPNLMAELGAGLAEFHCQLAGQLDRFTVVVMSEFGRRARENASLGTDHGRGGMMMVIGEGVSSGKVSGAWPGLAEKQLVGPGDLAVTTDFRDVLGEIILKKMGILSLEEIFPDFTPGFIEVIKTE